MELSATGEVKKMRIKSDGENGMGAPPSLLSPNILGAFLARFLLIVGWVKEVEEVCRKGGRRKKGTTGMCGPPNKQLGWLLRKIQWPANEWSRDNIMGRKQRRGEARECAHFCLLSIAIVCNTTHINSCSFFKSGGARAQSIV